MPEQTPPGDGAQGNPPDNSGTGTGQQSEPKKLEFTQDEFDRIIADRVARAKPKDYDDLVKLRDEQAAAEEAKKTELQKEKDARKAAEQAASERAAKANAKLIRAELLAEATAQKSSDPSIVVAMLSSDPAIEVDDEGGVTGVKEAVKKLLKDKPILGPAAAASGGQFGGTDQQTIDEKIAELERAGKFKEARDLKVQKMMATSA